MIASFADRGTEDLFHGRSTSRSRRFPPEIVQRAREKLDQLNNAHDLLDLNLPGNRLEVLRGNLAGLHSIRINVQWRIVFRWADGDAHEVRITDYH